MVSNLKKFLVFGGVELTPSRGLARFVWCGGTCQNQFRSSCADQAKIVLFWTRSQALFAVTHSQVLRFTVPLCREFTQCEIEFFCKPVIGEDGGICTGGGKGGKPHPKFDLVKSQALEALSSPSDQSQLHLMGFRWSFS